MFGYDRGDLLGQPIEVLVSRGPGPESIARRKDSAEFPVDIVLSPMESAGVTHVLYVVRESPAEAVREKEVLLREIHHRMKNNLAVLSSLFYLQSTYTQDPATLKLLEECTDRVRSMALVHETLYESEGLAAVDFAEYALALSKQLVSTYSLPGASVQLKTELEPVKLDLDLAVPCALILNEVMTNSLKHAYPAEHGGAGGEIRLAVRRESDGACVLEVRDLGVGLPAGLDFENSTSLGLRLIRSLTKQIDGSFMLRSTHPGTEARLTLHPEAHAEKR